jgi:hypothetical protein
MRQLMAAAITTLITTTVPGLAVQPVSAPPGVGAVLAQAGMTPAEKDAQSKLEAAGYSQVKDIKSSPEGVMAKAVKDGKEVAVVVDSAGKIKELRTGH